MTSQALFKSVHRLGILFFLATLSRSGVAMLSANESPTIVLVANQPDATIIASLRGELAALGMRVLVVQPGDHVVSPFDLTDAARLKHAIAAFRVIVEEGRVEVWLADRVTGKVLLREVLMAKGDNQPQTDESTVVARAVELLRASLLELDIDERPKGEVVAPVRLPPKLQAPIAAPPTQTAARWGLTTSVALLAASSRAAFSPGLGVALHWQPTPYFGTVARVTLPFDGPTYVAPEGRAQVTPRWASAGLRWTLPEFGRKFHASLESGLGFLFINIVGIGITGYSGRSSFDTDPVPYLGGDLRYSLSRSIAVSLGVLAGPGLKPSKIVFDTDVIDRYGRWTVVTLLGLELTWH